MLLGIDLGTSSVKAVLFDPDSVQIVASAAHEYPIYHPMPDRAEQNPDDWWNATVNAVRQAITRAGRSDVQAIGLCGQMHGVTLLNAKKKPIGNSIIWADQRSAAETRQLIERFGAENYTQITGTLPAAGFMVSTLAWMQKHDRKTLESARCVLLPKDVIRLMLTGEVATDISDASATGMFDVLVKTWSAEIIHELDLPRSLFPPALESAAVAGSLTAKAAAALGLKTGIPVVAGCADQPAQALANGLIAPGRASITIGSGGQVFTPVLPLVNGSISLKTDSRLHVFNHAVPGVWYILGAILSAGLSLRWLRDLFKTDYATLSAEAASVPAGANGLIFLPYLSGERTPHMDAHARGGFIGLTAIHGRGHLARAIMEGVAFAMHEALDISLGLGGQVDRVITAGGGAESDVWRHILADVLNVPLQKSLLTESTGIGAALLAGIGAGVYKNAESAAATAAYGEITEPDANLHAYYVNLYREYQSLYPRLKDNFHRLAELE